MLELCECEQKNDLENKIFEVTVSSLSTENFWVFIFFSFLHILASKVFIAIKMGFDESATFRFR